MDKFECWDDSEEAPEAGEGRMVEAANARMAAQEFADLDSDTQEMRVCVRRPHTGIGCFRVRFVSRVDVEEVEYKP